MPQPRARREVSPTPAVAQPSPSLDRLEWILRNLVWRALEETHASSAAIGVMHDNVMICRAVAGLSLAQVGAPIDTESGLTAMAVRREMSQWCTDTETDWRVDAEVCRRLNVRSMIVVPVRSAQSVVGILAIFSAAPDAFSLDNLNTLQKLAHWVAEALEPENRTVPPQNLATAKPEPAKTHPPLSLYSEPTHGMRIKKYLAKIWRALAPASQRGENDRTG